MNKVLTILFVISMFSINVSAKDNEFLKFDLGGGYPVVISSDLGEAFLGKMFPGITVQKPNISFDFALSYIDSKDLIFGFDGEIYQKQKFGDINNRVVEEYILSMDLLIGYRLEVFNSFIICPQIGFGYGSIHIAANNESGNPQITPDSLLVSIPKVYEIKSGFENIAGEVEFLYQFRVDAFDNRMKEKGYHRNYPNLSVSIKAKYQRFFTEEKWSSAGYFIDTPNDSFSIFKIGLYLGYNIFTN